ncbi:hypothetical protein [Granulicella sp. dw_53]|uniref:hypothetical protein n=1 Tax=Granulicella sp. dw_53 TaxID=2719792 RepID=UPI001BD31EFC|nr:hypothetical protein [Granulicella sp. dw_53]
MTTSISSSFSRLLLLLAAGLLTASSAQAIEVKVSAQALERTLRAQLFNSADGRYYMRGDISTPCYVYVDSPRISFKDDRVVVHVHTRAKIGTSVYGTCVGVPFNTEADVSFIPDAEGESIGFRDARIERLSENRELNFLLVPFLSRKLPSQMKVNAADLMRKLLLHSADTTGYALSLSSLKLHSMLVEGQNLTLDVDANMHVD